MPDAAPLLQIAPNRELIFEGPYTDVVTSTMNLKNITENTVCFKIKTTAPKQYCVRPNSGWLKPGDLKSVTVMLQPLEGGVPKNPERHKFMVQTCISPSEEVGDLEAFWKTVQPAQLTYAKLTVVFADHKGPDTTKTSQGVEDSFTSTHVSEVGSSPHNQQPQQIGSDSGKVAALSKSLKIALEEKDEAVRKTKGLEKELEGLLKANRKLQQSQGENGTVEGQFPALQVILMAFATLLIGLILGKLI